jgi:hypothetical protein
MIHGVIHLHKSLAGNFPVLVEARISLAGNFPVLMEARECEFNVTALLGLKTTGFGRPFYGFDWLFLPVFNKLLFIIVALHPESNKTLNLSFPPSLSACLSFM